MFSFAKEQRFKRQSVRERAHSQKLKRAYSTGMSRYRSRHHRRTRNVIPFDLRGSGGERVKVTWDSILWFGLVTTIASIAGSYLWSYVIQPELTPPPAPGANKISS